MRATWWVTLVLAGVLPAAPTLAGAQVVLFDRSADLPEIYEDGYGTSTGPFIHDNNIVASTFILSSPGTVGAVRFWGSEYLGWIDPGFVNWWIYTDLPDGPVPGGGNVGPASVIASGTATTSRSLVEVRDDYTTHAYTFSFSPLALGAEVFWLALNAPSLSSGNGFAWDYGLAVNDTHVTTWTTSTSPVPHDVLHHTTARFQILESATATVTPEPMSMVLLGTGLAGLAAAHRRRRRREDEPAT